MKLLNVILIIIGSFIFLSCSRQEKAKFSRGIENNSLISNADLARTFHVTEELQFLTDSAFVLKERSNAEVFFFADTKTGEIERFLQFQFESLKPEIEGTYNYHDVTDSIEIDGISMRQSYWCFDLKEVANERPKSDIAVVQKMINNKGATTTGMYVGKRFIYVSEDKRFEMLIIYGEKDSYRGIDCNNEETAVPLLQEMDKQVLKAFEIEDKD